MAEIKLDLNDIDLQRVSEKLKQNEWKGLGRRLGVDNLDQIKYDYKDDGLAEIIFQVLKRWQFKYSVEATKDKLIKALKSIGRQDILKELWEDSDHAAERCNERFAEIGILICEKQRKVYEKVKLPQAPWMKKILPLEELYVELEMFKTQGNSENSKGLPIKIEELFDTIDGVNPFRILIEGGPGFGKTALCLKLLNDWGRIRDYIASKFKMVFMFQLRYFRDSDSIEELLKRECQTSGIETHEAIQYIRAFESETLLILDGFDEMNEESKRNLLPLLLKKQFPSMYVLITTRKGMFHVEKKQENSVAGILETSEDDVDKEHLWNKKILIKGVTQDNIEVFMQKYLETDYKKLEKKLISITRGEVREILECPLFLVLVAVMLEDKKLEYVDSKTSLYKQFFNFITRRNLIREKKIQEDKNVDLFCNSSNDIVVESLFQFGRLSLDYLCQNKLLFEEEKIVDHCDNEVILHLGFLVKLTKFQNHQEDNFYQPIHKSFLEFVAAFTMWKLFCLDQDQFRRELERIGDRGLKPTTDSLFYVFLGGLMNSEAHILFQCLTPHYLWFNIENICFTNMLMEIQEIDRFYSSFKLLMAPFIPSVYYINWSTRENKDFFDSQMHALILKYASDQKLIKHIIWETSYSFKLLQTFHIETFELMILNEFCYKNELKFSIQCKNFIGIFYYSFDKDNWKYFVSLMNSIESEMYCIDLSLGDALILFLLYKEMNEGQWKEKNIDQLIVKLKDDDEVSLLVDLVKENRIKEAVRLNIDQTKIITEEKSILLRRETQKLIDAVTESKYVPIFLLTFDNFSHFDFKRAIQKKWRMLRFNDDSLAFLKAAENKNEQISVEEIYINRLSDEKDSHLLKNIEGIECLECSLNFFNSLVEMERVGFEKIKVLKLRYIEEKLLPINPRIFSQFMNLQVLSMAVYGIKTFHYECKDSFVNIFTSLNLRICEIVFPQKDEAFCFFIEIIMEGLKKKEEKAKSLTMDERNSTVELKRGKNVQLNELVIRFNTDFDELKQFKGFTWIRSMLRDKRLGRFTWTTYSYIYYHEIKQNEFLAIFPWKEKFRISRELDGVNISCRRDFEFRRYEMFGPVYKYSVQYTDH